MTSTATRPTAAGAVLVAAAFLPVPWMSWHGPRPYADVFAFAARSYPRTGTVPGEVARAFLLAGVVGYAAVAGVLLVAGAARRRAARWVAAVPVGLCAAYFLLLGASAVAEPDEGGAPAALVAVPPVLACVLALLGLLRRRPELVPAAVVILAVLAAGLVAVSMREVLSVREVLWAGTRVPAGDLRAGPGVALYVGGLLLGAGGQVLRLRGGAAVAPPPEPDPPAAPVPIRWAAALPPSSEAECPDRALRVLLAAGALGAGLLVTAVADVTWFDADARVSLADLPTLPGLPPLPTLPPVPALPPLPPLPSGGAR